MPGPSELRLRALGQSPGQRHIQAGDRYLYAPPEPTYRLNVIGTGMMGQEHMRVATLLGRARIHGVYDAAAGSVNAALDTLPKDAAEAVRRYDNLHSACHDPDADALLICTPNHTHIDVFEIAIQSEKPILLEKPMAITVADAAKVVTLAADYPSFVQLGLQYRYKAIYAEARYEALERSILGRVRTIGISEYRPSFLDKVDQWNKFAGNTGGTLVEKCCHYFDLMNGFAGAKPQRIFASGGQAVNFRGFERGGRTADIDDHAFVLIDYAGGVRATLTLCMFCPGFSEQLVLCGDTGRLCAEESFDFHQRDESRSTLTVELGEGGASRRTELSYPRLIEQSGHHGSTFFEHIAFLDRLDGQPGDAATLLEGLWSMIPACAAQESITTGQPVLIDDFIERHRLAEVLAL